MSTVVILGAGPIASELASALSGIGVTHIVLFDEEVQSVAAGKALDLLQSCPIIRSDTKLCGYAHASDVLGADLLVVADRGKDGQEWSGEAGLAQVARLLPRVTGPVVFAGAAQAWLLERCVAELGRSRGGAVGSAPLALRAAVQAMTALEADCAASDVAVTIAGRPPKEVAVLWDVSQIGGEAASLRLDQAALRRIEARLPALWPPGPFALASAASVVASAILRRIDRTLTCYTMHGSPGQPLALPVNIRNGEVQSVARLPRTAALSALGLV